MMDPAMVAALDQLQATVAMNAKSLKIMHDEYVRVGFTSDQAATFVQSMLDFSLQKRLMDEHDDTV